MSQIKVGDKVVRITAYQTGAWRKFAKGKEVFTVTSMVATGDYLQLDGIICGNIKHPWAYVNFKKVEVNQASDVVKSPKHYQFFPDVEAIEIIASALSVEGFRGYCMGNRLKYRLRAGNKDKLEQDIAKSDFYVELFNNHKHLCKDA